MTAAGTDARHLIPVSDGPEIRRCRNCGDLIDLNDVVTRASAVVQSSLHA